MNPSLPRVTNFHCSLTRNITSRTVWRTWLSIDFPDERWLHLPIDYLTHTSLFKTLGECTFWEWEWNALYRCTHGYLVAMLLLFHSFEQLLQFRHWQEPKSWELKTTQASTVPCSWPALGPGHWVHRPAGQNPDEGKNKMVCHVSEEKSNQIHD